MSSKFDNATDLVVASKNSYAEHVFKKFDNAAELVVVSKKSYGEHFSETVSETKSPTVFISYLVFRNLDCFQETSSENRVFKNSLPDKFFCVFQKIKTKTKTIQARS